MSESMTGPTGMLAQQSLLIRQLQADLDDAVELLAECLNGESLDWWKRARAFLVGLGRDQ